MFKAAILSALSPMQIFTPAQLGTIYKLCNVFHRRRPSKPPVPTWELRAFTFAPFEPSLEAVTYKTFVLTALALGTALCLTSRPVRLPGERLVFCVAIFRSVVFSHNGQGKTPYRAVQTQGTPAWRPSKGRRHGPVPSECLVGLYGNNGGPLVC